MELLPRFIRARDAHGYCGMCRAVFNQVLRPYLTEIPIGTQGVAFDRLEMDAALEQYKSRNGRPAKQGGLLWDAKPRPASSDEEARGISTKSYTDDDFERAVKQAISRKPSAI
jgi:hypothetical protein